MLKQKVFIIEAFESIYDISHPASFSLAIDLELKHIERAIVGFLLLEKELIDTLIVKDQHSRKKITIERHEMFRTSIRKGKLRARSIISKCDNNCWGLMITMNDVNCIITWYLRGFVDNEYQRLALDIECQESNMLMFSTKQTTV